ncbi:MAG: ABC transporter ATP-binding protein [Alphaproteobacteria bacterium]
MTAALELADVVAGYGATVVLDGVSLAVPAGGTLALLGRNGVGKSTLLTTIMGFTDMRAGRIAVAGQPVEKAPTIARVRAGLGYVPQEREIFPSLTVEENLAVAARPGGWSAERVYALFPRLAERRRNGGGKLSGGEQQMLAIGRALMGGPQVLLLDEPMEGLAPVIVEALYEALSELRDAGGMTMVLVEQKADLALDFARDVVVLDRGKVVHSGLCADMRHDEALKARLFAVGEDAI